MCNSTFAIRPLAHAEDAELPDIPDELLRGLVGGIAEVVRQCLLESPEDEVPERLRALTPTLVNFATVILTSG